MKLEKIRELCNKATPGPWHFTGSDIVRRFVPGDVVEGEVIDRELHGHVQTWHNGTAEDAAFVCAARTLLPILLNLWESAKVGGGMTRHLDALEAADVPPQD